MMRLPAGAGHQVPQGAAPLHGAALRAAMPVRRHRHRNPALSGNIRRSEFNAYGLPVKDTFPVGKAEEQVITLERDQFNGRITRVGFGATSAAPTAYQSVIDLTWDKANRLTGDGLYCTSLE